MGATNMLSSVSGRIDAAASQGVAKHQTATWTAKISSTNATGPRSALYFRIDPRLASGTSTCA